MCRIAECAERFLSCFCCHVCCFYVHTIANHDMLLYVASKNPSHYYIHLLCRRAHWLPAKQKETPAYMQGSR